MTPIEELNRLRTDPHYRLAKALAGPSLAQQKMSTVSKKLAEKKEAHDPAVAFSEELTERDALREAAFGGDATNGLNYSGLAFSSILRGGGNVTDFAKRGLNALTTNENPYFDASADTGYSNQTLADAAADVSIGDRKALSEGQDQVLQDVANDDIVGAILSAGKVALPTAFDSAGAGVEMAIGAAATALGYGAGAPLLMNRVRKITKGVEGAAERVKELKAIKLAKEAAQASDSKLEKGLRAAPGVALKTSAQTSVVNADMTQQQYSDYVAKYGEDPSIARQSAMMFGNALTLSANPAIITKLLLPNVKKQFVTEAQTLLKNMGKGSNIKNIIKRVGVNVVDIAKAGGAETAQEYLQTWQEILVNEISPEEADNLFAAIGKELGDKTNRERALQGGILGGAAGGATRGITGAPSLALGTAIDATKATAKGTFKTAKFAGKVALKGGQKVKRVGQKLANDASYKILSQEERDEVADKYKIDTEVADQKIAHNEEKIESVNSASSITELRENTDIAADVQEQQLKLKLTDEELDNPKKLKRLQNAVTKSIKAQSAVIDFEVQTSVAADIAKRSGKNIKIKSVEAAKKIAESIDIDVDEVVDKVKEYGEETVKAVRGLSSSTALGIIELASLKTAEGLKTAFEAAKSLERHDLERVAAVVNKIDPNAGRKFRKLYEQKTKIAEYTGLVINDSVTRKNIPEAVVATAKSGTVDANNMPAVTKQLQDTINSTIDDMYTLQQTEAALKAYENSKAYKGQVKGTMSDANLIIMKDRLAKAGRRLRKPIRSKIRKNLEATSAKIKEKGVIPYFKSSAAVTAIVKQLESVSEKTEAKEVWEKIKDAMPDISLPDPDNEAEVEAFHQAFEDTWNKIRKNFTETLLGPGEEIDEAAETTTKATPEGSKTPVEAQTLLSQFSQVVAATNDPAAVGAAFSSLIPRLKSYGIKTRAEMQQALSEHNGLDADAIQDIVNQEFAGEPDINVADPNEGDKHNPATPVNDKQKAKPLYQKFHPECPLPK